MKDKMSREELIRKLKEIAELKGDPEASHSRADDLLLEFINDKEVIDAFEAIEKWYA